MCMFDDAAFGVQPAVMNFDVSPYIDWLYNESWLSANL